jgi:predicted nuclease of restriction endonuclease-like (RecB) superfamily
VQSPTLFNINLPHGIAIYLCHHKIYFYLGFLFSGEKNMSIIPQYQDDFEKVYCMITKSKAEVWHNINATLIKLYWDVGCHVSIKVNKFSWGQNVVKELSKYILSQDSSSKGFSARNIWRMKQFYEAYRDYEALLGLVTKVSWANHLHILSKTKNIEEREFYLKLAAKNRYPERIFARLIDKATFERTALADKKLPALLTVFPCNIKGFFKDSYVFDFLSLPDRYSENDLRNSLIKQLKNFLLELGSGFSLIGEEYPIQVGMRDFRIDLLMYNRDLACLVALELKIGEFQPEYLGKMQFYLEALDRNVKKPHENPSIGIIICKTKDNEVVKYALNRNMSPTMVAEYETKLINKGLLQKKLHEFCVNT